MTNMGGGGLVEETGVLLRVLRRHAHPEQDCHAQPSRGHLQWIGTPSRSEVNMQQKH